MCPLCPLVDIQRVLPFFVCMNSAHSNSDDWILSGHSVHTEDDANCRSPSQTSSEISVTDLPNSDKLCTQTIDVCRGRNSTNSGQCIPAKMRSRSEPKLCEEIETANIVQFSRNRRSRRPMPMTRDDVCSINFAVEVIPWVIALIWMFSKLAIFLFEIH
jgi:hypothetical protein